jgi:glycerol-3-phosphate O-acyltransferase/dihydroxyacetone phosphate acyltransferase
MLDGTPSTEATQVKENLLNLEKLNSSKNPDPKLSKSSKSEFVYEPFPWFRLWIYDLFLWGFTIIFDCFFREIRPRGAFRLPRSGPVIFVAAPHANQFVDPIILMNQVKKESQRRISFLIAAKSYKKRIIGLLSKCQLSIPVVRAQDNLIKGSGKIFVDFENPMVIRGKATKFTKECSVRGLIALPQSLGASEIVEIISDTELVIRKEFKSTDQIKALLTNATSYKRADKVDQRQIYSMVFQHLSQGNCIGIFPEGGSHDRTDLLPLKAGVAIMALGAMEHDPNCNVTIVPCGMNYFNAHKFRSRAVVEFGHPIKISKDMVKKYSNPETNRESVKELLDIVTTGLKAVTVTCEDYETLMVIQAARRLYAGNFAQYLPLPLVVEMNRRLVLGYNTFKDNEQIQDIKKKILEYNQRLQQLYLPDHHVEACDETNKVRVIPILIYRVIKLVLCLILALPGATLFSPVFISSKIVSTRMAKDALANSTVKIKANDVIATWKILIGMGIAPVVYSFYACVGTYYCYTHRILSSYNLILLWCILYGCGVVVTYSALLAGEQGVDLFKSIRPLYLSITNGSSVKELKEFRAELSEEITFLVNSLGPQLFPDDFNLLHMKESLKISNGVKYVDSDEEEESKTQELRNRRMKKRKEAKRAAKAAEAAASGTSKDGTPPDEDSTSALSLDKHSSSVSDGISLMNSDNSLTNIPIFSDYHLHMNAKNTDLTLEQQSNFNSTANSTVSIFDDYNLRRANLSTASNLGNGQTGMLPVSPLGNTSFRGRVQRTDSDGHIEFNFEKKSKLSDKIKNKIRKNRQQ